MSFYEKFDALMAEEVATWPADKQAHFAASRALVVAAWPKCSTPAWQTFEILLHILEVGVTREVGQVGANMTSYSGRLECIRLMLIQIDSMSEKDKLDHGDMAYNMLGALSGVLKVLRAGCVSRAGG